MYKFLKVQQLINFWIMHTSGKVCWKTKTWLALCRSTAVPVLLGFPSWVYKNLIADSLQSKGSLMVQMSKLLFHNWETAGLIPGDAIAVRGQEFKRAQLTWLSWWNCQLSFSDENLKQSATNKDIKVNRKYQYQYQYLIGKSGYCAISNILHDCHSILWKVLCHSHDGVRKALW